MSENQVSQRIFTILSKNSAALQKVKIYNLGKIAPVQPVYKFLFIIRNIHNTNGKIQPHNIANFPQIPQNKTSLFIRRSTRFRFRCGLTVYHSKRSDNHILPRLPDHIISQYRSFVNYFPNICSVFTVLSCAFQRKRLYFWLFLWYYIEKHNFNKKRLANNNHVLSFRRIIETQSVFPIFILIFDFR